LQGGQVTLTNTPITDYSYAGVSLITAGGNVLVNQGVASGATVPFMFLPASKQAPGDLYEVTYQYESAAGAANVTSYLHSPTGHQLVIPSLPSGAAVSNSGGPGDAQSDASAPVAWVFQSASTNAAGMEVDLYCDGSAVRSITPTRMGKITDLEGNSLGTSPLFFPAGTQEILQCLTDIQQVGDLSSVVADGFCSKSVSFGTTTHVSGLGHITADLQCKLMPLSDAQSKMISDCEGLL